MPFGSPRAFCLCRSLAFHEKQGHLAYLESELGYPRAIHQDARRLQKHPIIEMHPERAVTDLQIHVVSPVQGVTLRLAPGRADHVIRAPFISIVADLPDFPDAPILLTVDQLWPGPARQDLVLYQIPRPLLRAAT